MELNFQTVPVQELVREIVELARPQADGGGIRVEVKQEADGVEVRVDRDLLKQAVLNVVVNAMEAMPEGGELALKPAAEDTVEIRISDTGKGIPPELRDKIFRLYFTTRKEGFGHRPGDDFPDRATSRWYNRFHQRTGEGNDLLDPPADCGLIEAFDMQRAKSILAVLMAIPLAGCVLRGKPAAKTPTSPSNPVTTPASTAPAKPPALSIPQTRAQLPSPQPLPEEALATSLPPEEGPPAPPVPVVKPPPKRPQTRPGTPTAEIPVRHAARNR